MKHPRQLGFGFDAIQEEHETAHLPSSMDDGVSLYRTMLVKNHEAMLAGDEKGARARLDGGYRRDARNCTDVGTEWGI
jgi:hypothetical protein